MRLAVQFSWKPTDSSMFCIGERLPATLAVRERRWITAAINASQGLAWAADQPTVLQPLPADACCESSAEASLQMQVCLSHIRAVSRSIEVLSGTAKPMMGSSSGNTDMPCSPPLGCRAGLWNATVDFLESTKHVHLLLEECRCHVLRAYSQR